MGNQLAEERRHRAARYEAGSIYPPADRCCRFRPCCCRYVARRYRRHPQTMDHPSATFNPKWQDRRDMGIKILPPSTTSVSRYRVECEKIILCFCLLLSAFVYNIISLYKQMCLLIQYIFYYFQLNKFY